MRSISKFLIALPAAALVVAACGGGTPATPTTAATRPAATATTAAQATATRAPQATAVAPTPTARPATTPTTSAAAPKRGGEVTGFITLDPINWDVVSEALGNNLVPQRGMYNGLVQFCPLGAGAANEVCSDLAKSWSFSQDGKQLIFQLYPGVKWHDGAPFSSADVVFTFNRMLDPNQASPINGALLRPYVQSVEAPDANTVVLNLKASSLALTPTLASAWFVVMAKHVWDKDKAFTEANVTGTGPFKFKEKQKGTFVQTQRNTTYFQSEWPYLDGYKFLIVPDSSTYTAAFKLGRVQLPYYYSGWNPVQWADFKKELGDKITGDLVPTLGTGGFLMNSNIKPFDDPRVRRAMRISLNMHEIITKAVNGVGLPGAVLDPDAFGEYALPYNDIKNLPGVREPTADDLAEAKRLLTEAGYANGFTTKLQYSLGGGGADYQTSFILAAAQYKKLGITLEDGGEDTRTIYTNMAKGNFTFTADIGRAVPIPDPQAVMAVYFVKDATLNYAHYVDPVLDRLYNEQFTTLDQKKRVQIIHDFQREVLKFRGATSPSRWERGYKGYWSEIKNLRFGASPYDGWTMERVWLEKK